MFLVFLKFNSGDEKLEENFINCKEYSEFFCVPNALVDSYITSLEPIQIKVFLYVLRFCGEKKSLCDIASDLNTNILEIKSSIEFLKNIGLLKSKIKLKKEDKVKPSIYETTFKYKKSDPEFVVNRISKSSEISFLVKEAQIILGRPVSNLDCAAIIMFHDTDGLPVNVILMLLQYTVSIGKNNMRYIEKVASSWGKEGIDTIEKAEKKIKDLQNKEKSWEKVRNLLELGNRAPTEKEKECCFNWINNLKISLDLIKEAYDKCINLKGRYIVKYIDAILKDWYNKKITSVERLKKYNFSCENLKKNKASSYNIEEYLTVMDTFA